MRNKPLYMVCAFLISVLTGYWVPMIFNSQVATVNSQTTPTTKATIYSVNETKPFYPENQENIYATDYSDFVYCKNANVCLLNESYQPFFKTDAQKSQYQYVLSKLDEFNLPRELAVIPIIESRYNPTAVSPKGAAGLWQLMPSVAKEYGIQKNDRFQLEASTNVALQHLKQLHHHYGNWELAIAAYNAGSKRVDDALVKNPDAKSIQDLNLPAETKNYVSTYYQMQNYKL